MNKRSNFYSNGEIIDFRLPKNLCSVGYIAVKESEILMSVTNGEKDILEDNGTYNIK